MKGDGRIVGQRWWKGEEKIGGRKRRKDRKLIQGLMLCGRANKSNSTADAVQVDANLEEELSFHLRFTKLKCC